LGIQTLREMRDSLREPIQNEEKLRVGEWVTFRLTTASGKIRRIKAQIRVIHKGSYYVVDTKGRTFLLLPQDIEEA